MIVQILQDFLNFFLSSADTIITFWLPLAWVSLLVLWLNQTRKRLLRRTSWELLTETPRAKMVVNGFIFIFVITLVRHILTIDHVVLDYLVSIRDNMMGLGIYGLILFFLWNYWQQIGAWILYVIEKWLDKGEMDMGMHHIQDMLEGSDLLKAAQARLHARTLIKILPNSGFTEIRVQVREVAYEFIPTLLETRARLIAAIRVAERKVSKYSRRKKLTQAQKRMVEEMRRDLKLFRTLLDGINERLQNIITWLETSGGRIQRAVIENTISQIGIHEVELLTDGIDDLYIQVRGYGAYVESEMLRARTEVSRVRPVTDLDSARDEANRRRDYDRTRRAADALKNR